jgi:hypothetical protein
MFSYVRHLEDDLENDCYWFFKKRFILYTIM